MLLPSTKLGRLGSDNHGVKLQHRDNHGVKLQHRDNHGVVL